MAINRTRTANHFKDHLSVFEPGYPIQKGYIGRLLYNDGRTISDVVAEVQAIVRAAEPDKHLHEGRLRGKVCAFNKLIKHKQLNLTAEWPSLIELFLQPFPIDFTSLPASVAAAIKTSDSGTSSPTFQRTKLRNLYPKEEQWLLNNYEPAEGICLLPDTFYDNYLSHCQEQGLNPMSSFLFVKLLRSVFPDLCRQLLNIRGEFRYHYCGLRIKASSSLNKFADEQTMALPQQQMQIKDNWTSNVGWQHTTRTGEFGLEDVSFASDIHEIQIYVYSSMPGHNIHNPIDVEETATTTVSNSNSSVHVRDILSDITSEYQTSNTTCMNEDVCYIQDVGSGENQKKQQNNQCKFDLLDFTFANNLYLKLHTRIHVEEKLSKCVFCGLIFTQIENLSEHLQTHIGKLYRCDVCGLTFTHFGSLSEHLQTHIGKLFRCKVCGLEFSHLADRTKHKKRHLKEWNYACDTCGRRCKTLSNLQMHIRMHTGEKPYQCRVCHKRFAHSHSITTHKRIHTGERPYKCDVCGFAFKQSSTLNSHKVIHTGEKPYMCDICGFQVNRKDNLRLHKKVHY